MAGKPFALSAILFTTNKSAKPISENTKPIKAGRFKAIEMPAVTALKASVIPNNMYVFLRTLLVSRTALS